MEDARCVIYGLSLDGTTHRYIGLTTGSIRARWASHASAAKRASKRTAVRCWIAKHGVENIKVTVLERCSSIEELREAERRWIKTLRDGGTALLNHTDGGEGTIGFHPTIEQRAAMGASRSGPRNANYGKPRPGHVRQKISEKLTGRPGANRGIPKSEEHKAKLRNRVVTEESRRKMSESAKKRAATFTGRTHTEETKEKLRAAASGRTHTDEARAKMGEAHRGKPKTPEHRAAIGAGIRRAYALRSSGVPSGH